MLVASVEGENPLASSQRSCGALYHVARPYQMVAAQVFIAHRIAPGNAGGSNKRAGKSLVFMGQKQVPAGAVKPAAIARCQLQRLESKAGALPLLDEFLPV